MRKACLVVLAGFMAAPALGQEDSTKATVEAVEACKAISSTFTEVSECLPGMDVALASLAAFSEIYPAAAQPLKDRCLELNEHQIGADSCVRKAIESALSLSDAMPDGSALDDPLFESIKSKADFERLEAARSEAKAKFPPNSGSGFVMYQPYR